MLAFPPQRHGSIDLSLASISKILGLKGYEILPDTRLRLVYCTCSIELHRYRSHRLVQFHRQACRSYQSPITTTNECSTKAAGVVDEGNSLYYLHQSHKIDPGRRGVWRRLSVRRAFVELFGLVKETPVFSSPPSSPPPYPSLSEKRSSRPTHRFSEKSQNPSHRVSDRETLPLVFSFFFF